MDIIRMVHCVSETTWSYTEISPCKKTAAGHYNNHGQHSLALQHFYIWQHFDVPT